MLPRISRTALSILWITVALTMVGCNRKTIYSRYQPTPLEGWEPNDRLTFSIEPMKTAGCYEEIVGLRTTSDYPFMRLTLIVEQELFPTHQLMVDTIDVPIVDEDGAILGNGVSTFQYTFPLRRLDLNQGDSLQVSIHHFMKRELLPGISDVGFAVARHQ
ncbi:MAG: gliding motility lipoprotein GldH [Prevotella sp.]|nr:gliding motility lipoprotein GldH [Prevotella sp.]